jgi:spore germination protein KB
MNKEVISDRQAISLVILFIWGSTLLIGAAGEAKKDRWLAIILGMILASFMALIYCRILNSFKEMDIFDINKLVFGSLVGSFVNILYIAFAITLGALVLNNFTEFISQVGLPDTPKPASILPIVLLTIWGVKCGIETLGRWAEFFVVILFIIITVPTILGVSKMDPHYILPVLQEGIQPVIKGTISAFSFPFAEMVVFLMVFSGLKNKKSIYKSYFIGLWEAGLAISAIVTRNILIVGPELLSRNFFPSYIALARINVADFVQRIETLNTVAFLIAGFVKVSICLLAASNGLAKLFKLDSYDIIVTPAALTMTAASFKAYESILETINWTRDVYPYYAAIFQVVLPMITYLLIKLKNKGIPKPI